MFNHNKEVLRSIKAKTYSDGVIAVLRGEMQKRPYCVSRYQDTMKVYPDYTTPVTLDRSPKQAAEIIRGAFVLRAMSTRGSWLKAADIEDIASSTEEVDHLVGSDGCVIRLNRLNVVRTLAYLSETGLAEIVIKNANINMADMARRAIYDYPEQVLTIYPEVRASNLVTNPIVHHINDADTL